MGQVCIYLWSGTRSLFDSSAQRLFQRPAAGYRIRDFHVSARRFLAPARQYVVFVYFRGQCRRSAGTSGVPGILSHLRDSIGGVASGAEPAFKSPNHRCQRRNRRCHGRLSDPASALKNINPHSYFFYSLFYRVDA